MSITAMRRTDVDDREGLVSDTDFDYGRDVLGETPINELELDPDDVDTEDDDDLDDEDDDFTDDDEDLDDEDDEDWSEFDDDDEDDDFDAASDD